MQNKLKFSTILKLFFIIVVIAPVLIISTYLLYTYEKDIVGQNSERVMQTSEALAHSIDQEIINYKRQLATVSINRNIIQAALKVNKSTDANKYISINELELLLEQSLVPISDHMNSVSFFYNTGEVFSYIDSLQDSQQLRESDWYKESLKQRNKIHFIGMINNPLNESKPPMIAVTISPSLYNSNDELELILFLIDISAFDHIFENNFTASKYHLIQLDGSLIASNQQSERGSTFRGSWPQQLGYEKNGYYIDTSSDEKQLLSYSKIKSIPWYTIVELPYNDIMSQYYQVRKGIWLISIIIIIAFISLSFYFVANITRPLNNLLQQISRFSEGDFSVRWTSSGSSEIVALGKSFNHMTVQIQQLLKEREKQEIAKRKAELTALQSQINPHFLINTLNQIKYMALLIQANSIRKLTHSLTQLLSATFNRGGPMTTIHEEVEYLQHYLYIMEIGYGRPIETTWEIADEVCNVYLLKMLQQPILENCIIHGLKEVADEAKIHIVMTKEKEYLKITISDNGKGLLNDDSKKRDGLDLFSGMGIKNVMERIALNYGNKYGLTYEINELGGTSAVFMLPYITSTTED